MAWGYRCEMIHWQDMLLESGLSIVSWSRSSWLQLHFGLLLTSLRLSLGSCLRRLVKAKGSSWDHMRYHPGTLAAGEKVEQPSAAVDPAAGRRVCVLTLGLP